MTHTVQELVAPYPVVIEIRIAWGEMDAFQHVNNVVYFRYFESVRIAYSERIAFMEYMNETGIGPILGASSCRFKMPLTYPDTISVGARAPKIDKDRFTMEYLIVSHSARKVAAVGDGVIVAYDYRQRKKVDLPEILIARVMALEGIDPSKPSDLSHDH